MNKQLRTALIFAPLLLITVIGALATTYDASSIPFYGSTGGGEIYFDTSFTADGGGWLYDCVYFINFNMNSLGTWSALGFGAQSGVVVHVLNATATSEIFITANATTAGKLVYVYMPDFAPSEITGDNSSTYSTTTSILTITLNSGFATIEITSTATTSFRLLDVVISAFSFFGIGDVGTKLFAVVNAFTTYFVSSATAVISLITQMMTIILFVSSSVIYWFTLLVSMIIDLATIIGNIFSGTSTVFAGVYGVSTGLGNLWDLFNWSVTAPFLVIVVFIYWLDGLHDRSKKSGQSDLQIAIGDIQIVSWIVGEVWNWTYTVFNFVFGTIMSIIGSLTGT